MSNHLYSPQKKQSDPKTLIIATVELATSPNLTLKNFLPECLDQSNEWVLSVAYVWMHAYRVLRYMHSPRQNINGMNMKNDFKARHFLGIWY